MLCKTSEVKQHIGLPAANTSKDALIEQIIKGVSGQIETITGRKFGETEYTETLDGNETNDITLAHYPIKSLASVKINDEAINLADEVAQKYLKIDKEAGIIYRQHGWRYGRLNVEIRYTAGYILPADEDESGLEGQTLPQAIRSAAIRLSARVYERSKAEGVGSASAASTTINYAAAIDPDIERTLKAFKKYKI